MRHSIRSRLIVLALLGMAAPVRAQNAVGVDLDTVTVGRFDMGRMWTFEYAPETYFSETYGFTADDAWFDRARMAALRIPGCSASFVSENGLVVTNHHCIRGRLVGVQRAGESLLDNGFLAESLADERQMPGMWADQLIGVHDVTATIDAAANAATEEARAQARSTAAEGITARMRAQYGDPSLRVQIIPLYNGGRYSAYVFRRYEDVRLVAAAELQAGFFGGDPDNFTYPRYAVDFAMMRIYGDDGRPVASPHHFTWSQDGVEEGDVVFVIGNPGPTTRLTTVAQLEFLRDVGVPATLNFFDTRLRALKAFYEEDPATGEALDLRNRMFSLSNTLKASIGRLQALNDPFVMKKRQEGERVLRDSLRADAELSTTYEPLFARISSLQDQKREIAGPHQAFVLLNNPTFASATIRRAIYAQLIADARGRDAPADSVAMYEASLAQIPDHPRGIERRFLVARFTDFERFLGAQHAVTRAALNGRTAAQAADALLAGSALADSARTAQALREGSLANDAAAALGAVLVPAVLDYQTRWGRLAQQEAELGAQFGHARLAIYGTTMPPDASSSPRITDGVVSSYEYNGTIAPPYTTFYGMYDRHFAHKGEPDWALPDRWLPVPPALDLATPLNFVSTADTYGGNSGSPAVTKELEIVGLNFDRNIEGLVRDYIFLPERGRNIMVDVRAIREALEAVYGLERIVAEIDRGRIE